jgi:hypothetical protein
MTRSRKNNQTIQIELLLTKMGLASVQTSVAGSKGTRRCFKPYDITTPQTSPSDTTVTQGGTNYYISATGISLTAAGKYAVQVAAQAYNDPTLDWTLPQYQTPPATAVTSPMDPNGDGHWSFSQVPGSGHDSTKGGPNNSTLLVWYAFGGMPPPPSQMDHTRYHGYLASGYHRAVRLPLDLSRPRVPKLHAVFSGGLALLGTVDLYWNDASWVAASDFFGDGGLTFVSAGALCHLVAPGPGISFALAAAPKSLHPFTWSAAGVAIGGVPVHFGVAVTA